MKERGLAERRASFVEQGLKVIRNRVDQFGVSEPTIQKQGDNRILVQLPGVQDPARAKSLIGKTAVLQFKLVDDQVVDVPRAIQEGPPAGDEVLYGRRVDRTTKTETRVPYVVRKETLLTGTHLDAKVRVSDEGEPYVSVTFDSVGAACSAKRPRRTSARGSRSSSTGTSTPRR